MEIHSNNMNNIVVVISITDNTILLLIILFQSRIKYVHFISLFYLLLYDI